MSKRVNVSFKDNSRDTYLLSQVNKSNDKSAFIKDCIEYYLREVKENGKR